MTLNCYGLFNQTTLKNKFGGLAAVFLMCLLPCSAQASRSKPGQEWRDLINTELFGSNCKSLEDTGEKKALLCKGVEGYSILVKGEPLQLRGEHQKPEVYLVAPAWASSTQTDESVGLASSPSARRCLNVNELKKRD